MKFNIVKKVNIPNKKEPKWFLIFLIMVIAMTVIFSAVFLKVVQNRMGFDNAKVFFFISLFVSLIICTFGYFGAKYIFVVSFSANVIGVMYMIYVLIEDYAGWGALVAPLGYIEMLIIGTVIGSIIELVKFIRRNYKQ